MQMVKELFEMPPTFRQNKLNAQQLPPTFTQAAPVALQGVNQGQSNQNTTQVANQVPTFIQGQIGYHFKVVQKVLTKGSRFALFNDGKEEKLLRSNLRYLYDNNNDPNLKLTPGGTRLCLLLDAKSNISGQKIVTGQTWRDFVIGLYNDKISTGNEFTTKHLKNIEKLWKHLNLNQVDFV